MVAATPVAAASPAMLAAPGACVRREARLIEPDTKHTPLAVRGCTAAGAAKRTRHITRSKPAAAKVSKLIVAQLAARVPHGAGSLSLQRRWPDIVEKLEHPAPPTLEDLPIG